MFQVTVSSAGQSQPWSCPDPVLGECPGTGPAQGSSLGEATRGTQGGAHKDFGDSVVPDAPVRESERRGCSGASAGTGGFSGIEMCLQSAGPGWGAQGRGTGGRWARGGSSDPGSRQGPRKLWD